MAYALFGGTAYLAFFAHKPINVYAGWAVIIGVYIQSIISLMDPRYPSDLAHKNKSGKA
jgi:hypothetical protein